MPNKIDPIKKLLGDVQTKPTSFEAALGLLTMEWIILVGLDVVIEGMDAMTHALNLRQDVEFNRPAPPPSEE